MFHEVLCLLVGLISRYGQAIARRLGAMSLEIRGKAPGSHTRKFRSRPEHSSL